MTLVTQSNQETEIEAKATDLVNMANRAVIESDDTLQKAGDLVKFIKTTFKKAEDERKALVKPFNDGVKAINARFASYTQPLDQAEQIMKEKMLQYSKQKERERREEAARIAKEEADKAFELAAQQEAAGNVQQADKTLSDAAEVEAMPIATPIATPIRGDYGSVSSVRKTWTYRVTDMQALATHQSGELVIANDRAIKDLIRDGVRDIAGIEIFQEESIVVR